MALDKFFLLSESPYSYQKMGTVIIGKGGAHDILGPGWTGRGESSWKEVCPRSAGVGDVVGEERGAGTSFPLELY